METDSNKQFRLATKTLFLTYPNKNITKYFSEKELLEQLKIILKKRNINIIVFNVSQEINANHRHYHVFLVLDKKIDSINKNVFDLTYKNMKFHGNYQSANKKTNRKENTKKTLVKEKKTKIVLNNKKIVTFSKTMIIVLQYCIKEIRFTWTNISWNSLKQLYPENFERSLLEKTLELY
jgi:hypothetical protein